THDPLCARMLGNPALQFTPLEGQLRPWDPDGPEEDDSSRVIVAIEGKAAEPEAALGDLPGRLLDRIGGELLSLRSLLTWPSPGLLGSEFLLWGVRSALLVALIFF